MGPKAPITATLSAPPSPGEWNVPNWSETAAPIPACCVHELISSQAKLTPQALAVQFEQKTLAYSELESRSNRLARYLSERGAQRGALVGLCVRRSEQMLVALLAIQKSGAAYVPLDPAYPKDRLQWILEHSKVSVLVTDEMSSRDLPGHQAVLVRLDTDEAAIAKELDEPVHSGVMPEDPIYVIYTSGSTGRPKGVQIPHRAVVNLLTSVAIKPGITPSDVLVGVTTLSFDIAGLEMYLPATVGGRLVIASQSDAHDGSRLSSLLESANATIMQATPATWRMLIDSGWKGTTRLKALCGGEALPRELASQILQRCGSLWNLYGPTETTIWSSVERVLPEEGPVLLGRPLANTQFYVVDENLRPVLSGEEGELCIGGSGLAIGYFRRPDLTQEKFVVPSFLAGTSSRIYRTGDLARFRADGKAEFLGRIDHQVKIRGFRIELGEIESVMEEHESVKQAIVVAREYTGDEKRLIAYFVARSSHTRGLHGLKTHLKAKLPEYMVPAALVALEAFPLTPNGKVDRKLLPEPTASDYSGEQEYIAPRTQVERGITRIIESATGIESIGVRTNLLQLGVHSLLAARIFMKLSREFNKDLPLAILFKAPTIEGLAAFVQKQSEDPCWPTLISIQPSGTKQPFFCVHGGAGTTLFLRPLSQRLGAEQPFYSLEPEGLDGKRITRRTVEAMAAHYLAEIRKVQPRGPYHVGGYCFGGLVAFEMARMLNQRGEEVSQLSLFNAPLRFNGRGSKKPGTDHKPTVQERLSRHSQEFSQRGALGKSAYLLSAAAKAGEWRLRNLWRVVRIRGQVKTCRLLSRLGITIPQALRGMYVLSMTHVAECAFVPGPYDGTMTLYRGKGLYQDPNLGWSSLAAKIDSVEIDGGTHRIRRDMMNEPIVQELASRLAADLEKVRASSALDGEIVQGASLKRSAMLSDAVTT